MDARPQIRIEFRGGPFDGHRQIVQLKPCEMNDFVMLPVNANLIRRLAGKGRTARSAPTSVAIYELDEQKGRTTYEFLGAIPPQQTCLCNRTI